MHANDHQFVIWHEKKERKFIYLSIENIIIENKNKIIHTQKGQKMSWLTLQASALKNQS